MLSLQVLLCSNSISLAGVGNLAFVCSVLTLRPQVLKSNCIVRVSNGLCLGWCCGHNESMSQNMTLTWNHNTIATRLYYIA
jgi:hypothetical protein